MIAGLMSNMFVSFYKCVLYDANTSIIRSPPQKTKTSGVPRTHLQISIVTLVQNNSKDIIYLNVIGR